MFLSAILVALLATMGQWWFFGPITKCLVYPLTTGTLVGLFMGDPMTGMLAGANIQLIYLGWISAGGTMPSNTIVAGIFGTAMTILSGADPSMGVTFAIPFSMLGLLLNQVYMTVNAAWIHQADKLLEKGSIRGVRLMNFVPSFCMAFILYGIPAYLLVMSGSGWAQNLIDAVTSSWRHHACFRYCNVVKLFRKEKADSLVLRRFLLNCLFRIRAHSNFHLLSYRCYLVIFK